MPANANGLNFNEFAKTLGKVVFEKRTAEIPGVFKQENVFAPTFWSQSAVNIMAQKYFRQAGVPDKTKLVSEQGVPYELSRRVPAEGATFSGESSVKQVTNRLAGAWTYWGWKEGIFVDVADAVAFRNTVEKLLLHQYLAPNSPQFFNQGLWWAYGITGEKANQYYVDPLDDQVRRSETSYTRSQNSACFILPIDDSLTGKDGITDAIRREADVFKFGSGSGTNVSNLRGVNEPLSGGGKSSGLMSFLRVFDRNAGAIKSGGTTRRAAVMRCLDADHPDLLEFIDWKLHEEHKVAALAHGSEIIKSRIEAIHSKAGDEKAIEKEASEAIKAGVPAGLIQRVVANVKTGVQTDFKQFDVSWTSEAYETVSGQNSNNSIRLTEAFMEAVRKLDGWPLYHRTELRKAKEENRNPVPCKVLKAQEVWDKIAYAAWACADPGLHFDTTIQEWHTGASTAPIRATNPCQPGFATVLTPEGIRTFDEVDVGSVIWDGTGWTKISKKWSTGEKPVFRFHTRAGVFVGTECHKVFQNGERVKAGEAESIDVCHGPSNVSPGLSSAGHVTQAVIDGWVFGDGLLKSSNNGKNKYPLICLGEDDVWVLEDERFNSFVTHQEFDKKYHRVKTTLSEDVLKTHLPERRIPEEYLQGDRQKVAEFLRGLYSANGSVCGGRVTLKSTCFEMIIQVQTMLSSLGIVSYYTTNAANDIKWGNGKTYTSRKSYDLNIIHGRKEFRDLIGFLHEGKANRLDKACEVKTRNWSKSTYEVVEIEALGILPVYDITVESDEHRYWTGGLLVSNCSEFHYIDNSSCNLLSINLCKFLNKTIFDDEMFRKVCAISTVILEISVYCGQFPSADIARVTHDHRTLGLGYANLGSLLMRLGAPYDSDKGRYIAASITALMQGVAINTSISLAKAVGPYKAYNENRQHVDRVVYNHVEATRRLANTKTSSSYKSLTIEPSLPAPKPEYGQFLFIARDAEKIIESAYSSLPKYGIRNAQVTVIAPTGTISFVMDCDTTGCEPDFALVKYKTLAGGGSMTIVNKAVTEALDNLNYKPEAAKEIVDYILKNGTIEGAPGLAPEDLPIFDCAVAARPGGREIAPEGHIDMLGALQPFISGSLSKTVNTGANTTVQQVKALHWRAYTKGLKCVAIFRDNCKLSQPLTVKAVDEEKSDEVIQLSSATAFVAPPTQDCNHSVRDRLPSRRSGYTQQMKLGGQSLFLRTGEYDDGRLGEIFITMSRDGATLRGMTNAFAVAVSLGLQYGVPLEEFVNAFTFTKFEPSGVVQEHDRIGIATSIVDLIFRDLAISYLGRQDLAHKNPAVEPEFGPAVQEVTVQQPVRAEAVQTGELCPTCGSSRLKRAGACKVCEDCGTTGGCG